VPTAGAQVTIPTGKTVLLDVSPLALKSLTIDGALVFAEQDLNLTADWIVVHGLLQAGTQAQPYRKRGVITLTGANTGENVMGMGTKLLGVMGGTLDLHGEPRLGWTRLAQSVAAGGKTLVLEQAPDWRAGDRVVIASSDYSYTQSEEREVQSVSGATVTLSTGLQYGHWGGSETIAGVDIRERAEVGLLTRNLVVQGDAGAETAGFGGHIMVHTSGIARIEGVELYRMGQKKVLGRYPFHWHLVADASASYFNNNSVHHTFNRCVTIHATNRATVRNNVAYDALGHCYFLEDGAETKNLIEGNLGVLTRRSDAADRLLASDETPATYWITNLDNTIRNNVAAGSMRFGFWVALPEHPTGISKSPTNDANIWPRRTPVLEFSGNVAHSNDDTGLFVDNGPTDDTSVETTFYQARQNPIPTVPDSAVVQSHFTGFFGWKNRGRAIWLRGNQLYIDGARLADNSIGATFAANEAYLQDSLVIGETANKGNPPTWETKGLDGRSLPLPWNIPFPIRGFEFYDGRVATLRTTFVNYQSNAQRKASGLSYNRDNEFATDPGNHAVAASFINANRVYEEDPHAAKDGDQSSVFLDSDGSVTGTAGAVVTVNNPFLVTSNCAFQAAWNTWVCTGNAYGRLSLQNRDPAPTSITPVTLSRDDTPAARTAMYGTVPPPQIATSVTANLIMARTYTVQFTGAEPGKLRLTMRLRSAGDWIRVAVPFSGTPIAYVYRDYNTSSQARLAGAASLAALDAGSGNLYFQDVAAGVVYVKMQIRPGYEYAVVDVCRTDRCQ